MGETVIKIQFDAGGNLCIPAGLISEAGFQELQPVRLGVSAGQITIREPDQFTDPDELLDYLHRKRQIDLCPYDKLLDEEEQPNSTWAELDQLLAGVTVLVEEYLSGQLGIPLTAET